MTAGDPVATDRPGLLGSVWPFWVLFSAIYLMLRWPFVATGRFIDPDDELRLVQVRDLLAGQSWFDLHQYRIDPPGGVVMHWSRLVDAPLAAVQLLLRPLLGPALAEQIATVIVPLGTFAVILFLLSRLAARLVDRDLAGYCAVIAVVSFPLASQVLPTRIDHHGWQIAAALAALLGLVDRAPRRGGALAGLSIAVGMAISLELLPIAALFGAVLLLQALRGAEGRERIGAFLLAVWAGSVTAFALTRGTDLTNYCDAVSPVYLAAMTIVCAAGSSIAVFPRLTMPAYLLILAASGGLALAAIAAINPQCLAGPFSSLDPLLGTLWYDRVAEGRPLFTMNGVLVTQWLVPPLMGLGAALVLWRRASDADRALWLDYALVLAGTVLLGVVVTRSMALAAAFAAVPVGWLVRDVAQNLTKRRGIGQWAMSLAVPVLAIMPALPAQFALSGVEALSAAPAKATAGAQPKAGNAPLQAQDLAAIGNLPRATIFATFDIGPTLLRTTHHSVVATGHHRGAVPMRDVMVAFIADPAAARHIVVRHKARYVILAPDLPEISNYREFAPRGLAVRLADGEIPDWLVPVPSATTARVKTFAVRY